MATTSRGYRYPALSSSPNVPQDIQNLASDINTDVQGLASQIACRLTQSTGQSGWTSGTYNAITFTAEDFDWGTIHDNVTNPSRINIGTKLGLWEISGQYSAAANANATNHRVKLSLNGSSVNGAIHSTGLATSSFVCLPLPTTFVVATVSTDYVELYGLQTAGSGTIGTTVNSEIRSTFQARWCGVQ